MDPAPASGFGISGKAHTFAGGGSESQKTVATVDPQYLGNGPESVGGVEFSIAAEVVFFPLGASGIGTGKLVAYIVLVTA